MVTLQYFIVSIYSVGLYIPYFGYAMKIIINHFSVGMIVMVLREAKMNFESLNFKLAIV